jgi:hypothetical protein
LYVRSLVATGSQEAQLRVLQQLHRLTDSGVFEGFSVHVVGTGLVHEDCSLQTEPGQRLLERLQAAERWQAANDVTVSGIETTTVTPSPLHERSYTVTKVPHCMLFEYEGEQLRFVCPSVVDEEVMSLPEYLDAVETRGGRPPTLDLTPVDVTFRGDESPPAEGGSTSTDPVMVRPRGTDASD